MIPRLQVEGRLGMDAEVKTWNGSQFISFRMANQEKKDKTVWYSVTADYERYKNMLPYLKKGSSLDVLGGYTDDLYTTRENKSGIERKLRVYDMHFVSSGQPKKEEGTQPVATAQPAQPVYQQPVAQPVYQAPQGVQQPIQQPMAQPVYQTPNAPDDDLPF